MSQDLTPLKTSKIKTIAVNDSWRLAPWAEMLYAADHKWWMHYEFCGDFEGAKWTQDKGPRGWVDRALSEGLHVVTCKHALGLSPDPSYVHSGWTSAFQAFNIAVQKGVKRVLLLGVDLQPTSERTHWFGEHPPELRRSSPYPTFRRSFEWAAPVCKQRGIEVINCSPVSILNCFPKMSLEDATREYLTA